MKYQVVDQKGKKAGEITLPKEIFDLEVNSDLVWQVAVSQKANRRRIIAHTKDRGEVRGGGRKPWRQKGTGRARHGSIRSPIWVGGGVTFGPTKDKKYSKVIPKKMKKLALFMVLSAKAKEKSMILIDELKFDKIKTKAMREILNKVSPDKKSALIVLPSLDQKLILSIRNIPRVESRQARDLNCLDLLSFQYLILPKESIKVIEEVFVNKKKK